MALEYSFEVVETWNVDLLFEMYACGRVWIVVICEGLAGNDMRTAFLLADAVVIPKLNKTLELISNNWHKEEEKSNSIPYIILVVLPKAYKAVKVAL